MTQKWLEVSEGGTPLTIRALGIFARVFGRRVSRLILPIITLYFFFRRGVVRRASREFFRRLTGKPGTVWQTLKHMHVFSTSTLDRVYLVSGQMDGFDVHVNGLEVLRAKKDMQRGVLIFGAHLGSFESMRVLSLRRPDVKFRAVLDVGQNPSIMRVLEELNPRLAAGIINARQDGMSTALAIKEAVDEGALVTMLVDRARPDNAKTLVNFLGSPAAFPASPWMLAATLKVPVVLCFGLYRGGNRYDLHFEAFEDVVTLQRSNREQAINQLAQRFADRLAHYTQLAPYNWFNFYDFWHIEGDSAAQLSADEHSSSRKRA